MTEHSMCQPGRPLPHGLSQKGSPSFLDFSDAFQHKGVTERKAKTYGH